MSNIELHWLPKSQDWPADVKRLEAGDLEGDLWSKLRGLANARIEFLATNRLDRLLLRHFGDAPPQNLGTKPVRLALLGSSTLDYLAPAIRIAALRRDIWAQVYVPTYGQYLQELLDPNSGLYRFKPTHVLFAFDAPHLVGALDAGADAATARAEFDATLKRVRDVWKMAQDSLRASVLQQTVLPVFPPLMGNAEHRLAGSRDQCIAEINAELRRMADEERVEVLALDRRVARDGLDAWHSSALWHRAKQEIRPDAAPMYGDLVARLVAAQQGRSAKCLVLDLDNTLWGGVIGDDGLQGIVLGQGNALGEAFVSFQAYARDLGRRGVILAVCSKNDEENAVAAFTDHPEMVLRLSDIACFVANWRDKASNIRAIAKELNIGLDALVFVDDNPFERNLIRQELPMVGVPEVSTDPGAFAQCLADAGYFETVAITDEDRGRNQLYQENRQRDALREETTDLTSYLRQLDMRMVARGFDAVGRQRVVQLINKTNQFNLTTRRYTEDDVDAVASDPKAFGLQLRLLDRFGDNGIIAIVIGRVDAGGSMLIDTWLMSCRVLGRQVEECTLNLIAEAAHRLGARRLVGEFRPTAKNGMVREHYARLGFTGSEALPDGSVRSYLSLDEFKPFPTFIEVVEG